MSSKVKGAYLSVIGTKRSLVLVLEDGSEVAQEIDKKQHKLNNFLRKHGITMSQPVNNTQQFIGQTFK